MRAALNVADAITTVSPNYAREILTPEYGCGLENLLRRRGSDVRGILNGVDYEEWNTTSNPALPATYNAADPAGKALCKAALQQELRQIREAENEQIRALLTPAQRTRFETVLQQRKAMHGSSRDERIL